MNIDFEKMGGLVPVIVQDSDTMKVLMLGFMNEEAYNKTVATKKVTFYSRSRKCLWTKGESSGNFLNVVSIKNDCDNDTLLIEAMPEGPVCHTGTDTCWGEENKANPLMFLSSLQDFIEKRHDEADIGFGQPLHQSATSFSSSPNWLVILMQSSTSTISTSEIAAPRFGL